MEENFLKQLRTKLVQHDSKALEKLQIVKQDQVYFDLYTEIANRGGWKQALLWNQWDFLSKKFGFKPEVLRKKYEDYLFVLESDYTKVQSPCLFRGANLKYPGKLQFSLDESHWEEGFSHGFSLYFDYVRSVFEIDLSNLNTQNSSSLDFESMKPVIDKLPKALNPYASLLKYISHAPHMNVIEDKPVCIKGGIGTQMVCINTYSPIFWVGIDYLKAKQLKQSGLNIFKEMPTEDTLLNLQEEVYMCVQRPGDLFLAKADKVYWVYSKGKAAFVTWHLLDSKSFETVTKLYSVFEKSSIDLPNLCLNLLNTQISSLNDIIINTAKDFVLANLENFGNIDDDIFELETQCKERCQVCKKHILWRYVVCKCNSTMCSRCLHNCRFSYYEKFSEKAYLVLLKRIENYQDPASAEFQRELIKKPIMQINCLDKTITLTPQTVKKLYRQLKPSIPKKRPPSITRISLNREKSCFEALVDKKSTSALSSLISKKRKLELTQQKQETPKNMSLIPKKKLSKS